MGQPVPRLTEVTIRNARPSVHGGLLADSGRLFLRLRATAENGISRGWIVRITRNGQ